jgi:plastocyanin
MKSKVLYIVGGVVVVGLGAYYFRNYTAQAPEVTDSQSRVQQSPTSSADNTPVASAPAADPAPASKPDKAADSTPHFSNESDLDGADVMVVEVDYDGTAFTPATVNIKAGDIVVFKNKGKSDFWPASNPHPTHTDYPEFDAKKPVPAGGQFQFKFVKAGNWAYHNHMSPGIKGIVNVSK